MSSLFKKAFFNKEQTISLFKYAKNVGIEFFSTIGDVKTLDWFSRLDPPGYKISQRGQSIPPDEQYLTFLQLVAPIKDKCLFIRGGNHDFLRSFNILDFDVCKTLAAELNVPYYPYPGYSEIKVKDKKWYMVSGHGKSGAKNGDLELDKLAAVYSKGDVFLLGHNHQLYAKPVDSIIVDGNEEALHRRWYIRGGSFLRYAEYARYAMYPIVRTGWITMEFTEDGIDTIANLATEVNSSVENIGARRLHTIIEKVLDDISFTATDKSGEKIIINSEYVTKNLGELVKDTDLSKFIL